MITNLGLLLMEIALLERIAVYTKPDLRRIPAGAYYGYGAFDQ